LNILPMCWSRIIIWEEENTMLFSERYGYEPPKPLQVESMDVDLKTAIHNIIVEFQRSNRI